MKIRTPVRQRQGNDKRMTITAGNLVNNVGSSLRQAQKTCVQVKTECPEVETPSFSGVQISHEGWREHSTFICKPERIRLVFALWGGGGMNFMGKHYEFIVVLLKTPLLIWLIANWRGNPLASTLMCPLPYPWENIHKIYGSFTYRGYLRGVRQKESGWGSYAPGRMVADDNLPVPERNR